MGLNNIYLSDSMSRKNLNNRVRRIIRSELEASGYIYIHGLGKDAEKRSPTETLEDISFELSTHYPTEGVVSAKGMRKGWKINERRQSMEVRSEVGSPPVQRTPDCGGTYDLIQVYKCVSKV